MSRPMCQGARKDGQPCRAPALPGSTWCWAHAPERQEIAARARAAGASKGGKVRALQGKRRRLESPVQLARFLSELVQSTLEGQTEPDIARVCFYGASVLRQVTESAELERRLTALEQQLAQ